METEYEGQIKLHIETENKVIECKISQYKN